MGPIGHPEPIGPIRPWWTDGRRAAAGGRRAAHGQRAGGQRKGGRTAGKRRAGGRAGGRVGIRNFGQDTLKSTH